MTHVDRIALGDAGSVAFRIDGGGATIDDVVVAPGWHLAARHPHLGLFRRTQRRPSPVIFVVLRDSPQPVRREWEQEVDEPIGREWELEVNRLDDGHWEHTVREQWAVPAGTAVAPVSTPAGTMTTTIRGGQVAVDRADPVAGWTMRTEHHNSDDEDVVVVFSRGTEDWEVVVMAEADEAGATLVEREHRRRIPPITT